MTHPHRGLSSPILLLVIGAAIILGIGYLATQKGNQQSVLGTESVSSTTRSTSRYAGNRWDLSFEYPSNWKLTEKDVFPAGVIIEGDGHVFVFREHNMKGNPAGLGYRDVTYVVSGQEVIAMEEETHSGTRFWSMMGLDHCGGMVIEITGPVGSKEVVNRVLGSVTCAT